MEVILSESVRVVRARRGVLIVEHRLGFIMANAGVDQSNVAPADGAHRALLLPENPDRSAEALRRGLAALTGVDIAVVINDSFGRPWRRGTVGVAIGAAGLPALIDLRGRPDLFGRKLEVSVIGFADEIAAAASLVMGQADEALAGGADTRACAGPLRNRRRPASFVPQTRICFDEPGSCGRSLRRHRGRQARAGPQPDRTGRTISSSWPMSATISSISGCISRRTPTR